MKKYFLDFLVLLICVLVFNSGYARLGGGDPGGDPDDEGSVPDNVEFQALKDIYDVLGGPNWTNRTGWPLPGNWPSSATSSEMAGWFGITVANKDITQIRLGNNNLVGNLPTSMGNLTSLTRLYLYNNQLSGALPPEMGNLSNLAVIQLYGNQLSGSIPTTFGDLVSLIHLHLGANQLSGQIPSELGNLTMLSELYLYNNQLMGTIPQSLSALTNLRILSLEENDLSGSIPVQIANLTSLEYLGLNGNQFSGPIPSELGNLDNLVYLRLDGNQFTGTIPATLGNLSHLKYLRLAANPLTGSIPASLGNLSSLTHLYLYNNQLSGDIPPSLGSLSNLLVMQLYGNQLTGSIPSEFGNLTSAIHLHLADNQLSGTVPPELGNIANLSELYLYDNNLSGEIPESMGNLANLKYLGLSYNQLSGAIPSSLGNLNKLISLQLDNNKLTANIPSTIGNLAQLDILFLQNNKLEGDVPSSLCSLPKVTYIFLYGNYLTGLPNFYNQVNKANLNLRVNNNYLSFGELEPLFTTLPNGIKTFVCSPQRKFSDVLRIHVPVGVELNIQAADPGSNSTITWEKQTGSTWQNVSSQSEDATLRTYKITNATSLINGTYRWRMTNSKIANLTLESEAIVVEAVDPIPATVSTSALYNGLITVARWRTDMASGTGDEEFRGMYTYKYDEKYQLKEANWTDPIDLSAPTNIFRVTGLDYDPNGNILGLKRYNAEGMRIHNFTYEYNTDPIDPKTNQLKNIPGYAAYNYDAVGRMTEEIKQSGDDQFVEYDVAGKIRKVFSDAAKTQLKVEFIYDDRGFRLAKVNHDQSSLKTTWYIRDASGNIISVYEQDGIVTNDAEGMPVLKTETLDQTEVPIYGAGKLGTFYPDEDGSTAYEITDHLGNVRALVRDNIEIYTATMEDNGQAEYTNPRVQEMQFFQNLFETEKDDPNMNHTSATETIVSNPSMSAYLFWQEDVGGMDAEDKAIGPAAALRVNQEDEVSLEAWVRYKNQEDFTERHYTNDIPLLMLSELLGSTFSGSGAFEAYSPAQAASTFDIALGNGGFGSDGTDTAPFAYLNFILFDENLNMLDAGWRRVPDDAGFDTGEENLPDMHRKIEFEEPIMVSQAGYMYIWVSNESQNTKVWFDDLKITSYAKSCNPGNGLWCLGRCDPRAED